MKKSYICLQFVFNWESRSSYWLMRTAFEQRQAITLSFPLLHWKKKSKKHFLTCTTETKTTCMDPNYGRDHRKPKNDSALLRWFVHTGPKQIHSTTEILNIPTKQDRMFFLTAGRCLASFCSWSVRRWNGGRYFEPPLTFQVSSSFLASSRSQFNWRKETILLPTMLDDLQTSTLKTLWRSSPCCCTLQPCLTKTKRNRLQRMKKKCSVNNPL